MKIFGHFKPALELHCFKIGEQKHISAQEIAKGICVWYEMVN